MYQKQIKKQKEIPSYLIEIKGEKKYEIKNILNKRIERIYIADKDI